MKKILGYIIAILGLQIILTFLKKAPHSVEYYYSSHFYLFINNLLTNFNKRFQFSIGDWLYVFIAFLLILELFKIIRNRKEENIIKNIIELLFKNIFNFIIIPLFLILYYIYYHNFTYVSTMIFLTIALPIFIYYCTLLLCGIQKSSIPYSFKLGIELFMVRPLGFEPRTHRL